MPTRNIESSSKRAIVIFELRMYFINQKQRFVWYLPGLSTSIKMQGLDTLQSQLQRSQRKRK